MVMPQPLAVLNVQQEGNEIGKILILLKCSVHIVLAIQDGDFAALRNEVLSH